MSELDDKEAEMLGYGYTRIGEHNSLREGMRVYHVGQQWPLVWERGTATLERVFRSEGSFWEQKYRRPDVEVLVTTDNGEVHQWANYHCMTADQQPAYLTEEPA